MALASTVMGRFFVGSRSGEDARYRQKETNLANSLKAPTEFDTIKLPKDPSCIPADWLQARITSLFKCHLHFEDDITASMVAEMVRRGEDARNILVTVTALSHSQPAAFKVMQELWQSLPNAPHQTHCDNIINNGPTGNGIVDELTMMRRRVERNVERKIKDDKAIKEAVKRTTKTSVIRPQRRSRSPKRHQHEHYSALDSNHHNVTNNEHDQHDRRPSSTSWEQKMREKAWEAATLSRLNK